VVGDGEAGATAASSTIPAFWRENYESLSNFKLSEMMEVAGRRLGLLTNARFDYRRLAMEEIAKYSRSKMVELASVLAEGGTGIELSEVGTARHQGSTPRHHEKET